jgi:pimeloyl-ACP methyl ester carboxylesterase
MLKGACRQVAIAGSGQPLVLLHGFPLEHSMWQPQLDALADCCQVLAPDLRGFGGSSWEESAPRVAREGVDMQTYAQDVIALLDELQITEPVILCGFSMGGYILWQLALRYPERIKALVLADTKAAADSAEASAGRLAMAEQVMASGGAGVAEGMLPKLLAASTRASRPELVEQVAAMIRQAPPAAIAAALRGMARRADVQPQLAGMDWPTLVLVGEEDVISPPEEMRAVAARLPQAEYHEISGAGHMSPLENPVDFNRALRAFVVRLTKNA